MPTQMKTILVIVFIGVLAIIAGFFLYRSHTTMPPTLAPPQKSITSFDECAAAGYPIMESSPEQCRTPQGQTFVNEHAQVAGSVGGCVVGGCSGEVCSNTSEGPAVSSCIYRAEFACYKSAKCERQSNGQCGWTQTTELKMCIANAPNTAPEQIY